MSNRPLGLGEGKDVPDLTLERFSVELPTTRPLILKAIGSILELGQIQKIVLEVKKPIEYWRLEPKKAVPDVPDFVETEDLYAAIMNAPMEEIASPKGGWPSGAVAILTVLGIIGDRKLSPLTIMTENQTELSDFVKLQWNRQIAGVPVRSHGDIPDEVLIVAASEDGETVSRSFKMFMELSQPVKKGK